MERERRAPAPPVDPSGIEEPHDILAAEQFAVPAPDARRPPTDPTGIEEPHDVLAADQFAIPAPPERPPIDPSGIEEPHDVLAAEQFAVPAPDTAGTSDSSPSAEAAGSERPAAGAARSSDRRCGGGGYVRCALALAARAPLVPRACTAELRR